MTGGLIPRTPADAVHRHSAYNAVIHQGIEINIKGAVGHGDGLGQGKRFIVSPGLKLGKSIISVEKPPPGSGFTVTPLEFVTPVPPALSTVNGFETPPLSPPPSEFQKMSSTKVSSIVSTNRVMSTEPVLVTVKEPVSNVESPETVTCAEPVTAFGVVPSSVTLPQFDSNGAAEPEVASCELSGGCPFCPNRKR